MKIFISHAIKDKDHIEHIDKTLSPYGFELLIAEHFQDVNNIISEKIEKLINSCDIALILLTEKGFNSNFVQQEIGYIKKSNKPFIQLVQKGLGNQITGFNFGRDYISYDVENRESSLIIVKETLLNQWKLLEEKKRKENLARINYINAINEQKRKDNEKIALALGAGLLLLAIASE